MPIGKIRELTKVLRGKDVQFLELLATSHFVSKDLANKDRSASDKDVVKSIRDLKPHFAEEQILEAIQLLRSQNWLS